MEKPARINLRGDYFIPKQIQTARFPIFTFGASARERTSRHEFCFIRSTAKMVELKDKIKTALDENRMLVLVVQVLVGFQFKGAFEPGFKRLPILLQHVKLGAFAFMLVTLALLLTPPSYHRIVARGECTRDFHEVLTGIMEWALMPFAVGLGLDVFVPCEKLLGMSGGIFCGIGALGVALFFWYGLPAFRRSRREHRVHQKELMKNQASDEKASLKDKITQVLTEGRVVLPGTQALLGFQLVTFMSDAFEKLPRSLQMTHLAALGLIAFSAILLMTPPAYHRLVEHGEDTEHFLRLASVFVVVAMIPLALGIAVDFFVVVKKTTDSSPFAWGFASGTLAIFFGLWFAFPLLRVRKSL
jgi:hypothetical protein